MFCIDIIIFNILAKNWIENLELKFIRKQINLFWMKKNFNRGSWAKKVYCNDENVTFTTLLGKLEVQTY